MFKICICDNDTDFLLNLNDKLSKIANYNNIEINIIKYSSSKQLLFDMDEQKDSIDIYFLGILLGDLTGLDIANELRKFNISSQIIFITSSKDYVFDAFDVMPLHYLIKQELNNKKLEEVFIKAISLVKPNKNNFFYYKVGHNMKCIDKDKIVYFEIKNRIVTMKCNNNTIEEFYFTMKELVQKIKSDNFVQIHRSFLVNINYIKSIESKNLILYDDTTLPVGEKYIKNVRSQYDKLF